VVYPLCVVVNAVSLELVRTVHGGVVLQTLFCVFRGMPNRRVLQLTFGLSSTWNSNNDSLVFLLFLVIGLLFIIKVHPSQRLIFLVGLFEHLLLLFVLVKDLCVVPLLVVSTSFFLALAEEQTGVVRCIHALFDVAVLALHDVLFLNLYALCSVHEWRFPMFFVETFIESGYHSKVLASLLSLQKKHVVNAPLLFLLVDQLFLIEEDLAVAH
jgi:hypothetical protein